MFCFLGFDHTTVDILLAPLSVHSGSSQLKGIPSLHQLLPLDPETWWTGPKVETLGNLIDCPPGSQQFINEQVHLRFIELMYTRY